MSKAMKKGLALALVAAMALSACSSAVEQKSAEPPAAPSTPSTSTPAAPETPAAPAEQKEDKYQIKELVLGKLASNELDSFNVLKSQTGATTENVIQFVDGLCETDNLGRVTPGLATEWETKDGDPYTTAEMAEIAANKGK